MRSLEFNDIYFSAEDGLAETQHTFLGGNNLPAAWQGRDQFCICETGFGTGLNMLAAWRLFEDTAQSHQRLDLVSFEKYPLTPEQIREALSPWDLQPQLDRLLACYPLRVRGFHRLNLTPRVTLTLVFDDVLTALPQLDACVDAWFLDGFAPAKNPDMWSPALFAHMARLSNGGASVATFTAAGIVRRGLAEVGFHVEKKRGYGRKRDMSVARFEGVPAQGEKFHQNIAIIGAGLAGLSAAWHLRRAGFDVCVYDAGDIASGASGNIAGLVNPKLSVNPSPQTAYYTSAYVYARHMLRELAVSSYAAVGSLHLQTNDDRSRRFDGYCANLGWEAQHIQKLSVTQASDIAGLRVPTPGLYYPDAAHVAPREICEKLAEGLEVRTNMRIEDLSGFACVVLANAGSVREFCDVPVGNVRGQVSVVEGNTASAGLKTNLCYGGYFTPDIGGGTHMCGASFQPWDTDPSVRDDDHACNLAGLAENMPNLSGFTVTGGRTGFRAASRDRFPIVGQKDGLFLSVAHGSHGIISGFMAGAVLAARIANTPSPIGADSINALSPIRF